MSRIRIAPIVEGHGEDNAIRILIWRVWTELLRGEYVEVYKPIRVNKHKFLKSAELERAVNLALLKVKASDVGDPSLILILLDADSDLPCVLGPALLARANKIRSDSDFSCVIANLEYETWFIAAAESLADYLDLSQDAAIPENPEKARLGKAWIQKRFRALKYSETVDQPAMTQAMDLELCRRRSPSFDKLCRELQARLEAGGR